MLGSGCSDSGQALDPAAQLSWGWQQYRTGEYNQAARAFESALQSPQTSEEHIKALYGLGTVWSLRAPGPDPAKAAGYFHQVIEQNPKHDLAAWSQLALARMKHLAPVGTEPDYAEVRQAYQVCIDSFPGHLASQEAFILQQSTYVATLKPEDAQKAIDALQGFIKSQPRSGFVSPAYMLLSEAYTVLSQMDTALASRVSALESAERDVDSGQDKAIDYWKVAVIAEFDAGDFKIARKFYRALIDEYPTDMRVYGAKLALKRMDTVEAKLRAGEPVSAEGSEK